MAQKGRKRKNIIGQRFGKLIAVRYVERKGHRSLWEFLCDCGNRKVIGLNNLSETKSCGCLRIKAARERARIHGRSQSTEFCLWSSAKIRADKAGLPFDITVKDVVVPEFCPVFGIRLKRAEGTRRGESPSLDRFDMAKGYVKGNIRVISWRANRLKSDMTLEDCEKLLEYLKGNR
jgi:hypothetical protein